MKQNNELTYWLIILVISNIALLLTHNIELGKNTVPSISLGLVIAMIGAMLIRVSMLLKRKFKEEEQKGRKSEKGDKDGKSENRNELFKDK